MANSRAAKNLAYGKTRIKMGKIVFNSMPMPQAKPSYNPHSPENYGRAMERAFKQTKVFGTPFSKKK